MNTTYTVNIPENACENYDGTYKEALSVAIDILSQLSEVERPTMCVSVNENHEAVHNPQPVYIQVVNKLARLREAQEKRSNYASKARIAKQEANANYAQTILDVLAANEHMTITDIMGASSAFAGLSNQKVTSIIKGLVDSGRVVKAIDKRKSYFSIAA